MTAVRDENKTQANRAYNLMFEAAREQLLKRSGEEIAAAAGAVYDPAESRLHFMTMGQEVSVSLPACTSEPVLENWHYLVLLHYLCNADGAPLTGERITIRNVGDGMIRGTKFERTANEVFQRILKNKSEATVLSACREMGAEVIDGRGDLSVCIPFLPNCPFYVNFWFADDEFPANGKMFFDRSADHYLSIEDAVTVGEIVLNRLEAGLNR